MKNTEASLYCKTNIGLVAISTLVWLLISVFHCQRLPFDVPWEGAYKAQCQTGRMNGNVVYVTFGRVCWSSKRTAFGAWYVLSLCLLPPHLILVF